MRVDHAMKYSWPRAVLGLDHTDLKSRCIMVQEFGIWQMGLGPVLFSCRAALASLKDFFVGCRHGSLPLGEGCKSRKQNTSQQMIIISRIHFNSSPTLVVSPRTPTTVINNNSNQRWSCSKGIWSSTSSASQCHKPKEHP